MHPFGGTPVCPRCEKAVYAAEQVSRWYYIFLHNLDFSRSWAPAERRVYSPLPHSTLINIIFSALSQGKLVNPMVIVVFNIVQPCLKCSTCNKRLDSYTLLEHDQEVRLVYPYRLDLIPSFSHTGMRYYAL